MTRRAPSSTRFYDRRPVLIVRPVDSGDVSKTVLAAAEIGLELAVRSNLPLVLRRTIDDTIEPELSPAEYYGLAEDWPGPEPRFWS
jgi:hypothetical protein